ncbi:MAG TPA: carbon-nitrogen hydrolase family protein [Ktedonobacteraceae bacterium]|nr:carbon-nitrogen hydrolase family protein [Ktedonobacteraceae bacterium]
MNITIALLQMTSCGNDQAANLAKGEEYCRHAKIMGADIALFPEMWNIGYTPYFPLDQEPCDVWRAPEKWQDGAISPHAALQQEREQWQAQAISRDDQFVTYFRTLARELDMAIAITYLERWQGAPRNTVSLIDRHGEIVLTYAKVHTCDFSMMEASCTPGDDFYVCNLDTGQGNVRVGTMICFDREFPESARILMLKGAELILTPNACPMEENRIGQFRARAYENMLGVALTNYAVPQENGHSIAFDPFVFDDNGSRNTLVVEAGGSEGIYLATFDIDRLREWRQREVMGNAFRKVHRYSLLTSLDVENPFIRTNGNGEVYDRTSR